MRVLVLDAALAFCAAAISIDGRIAAEQRVVRAIGQSNLLPTMADAVLEACGLSASELDFVAVTVGPGSFTGIRGALALAHGIRLAAGRPIVGVTVPEALEQDLPNVIGRDVWVAINSLRGHVFLARGGIISACALVRLPAPSAPVAIAGDAAIEVATRLASTGANVMLTDARAPSSGAIAAVGLRRHLGQLPSLPAQPLYVDPPAVRAPSREPRLPPGS